MTDQAEETARGLADQWAIETGFTDVQGQWQAASPAAITKVAGLLAQHDRQPLEFPHSDALPVAYQGSGHRRWILAAQLYSVRSSRNWGIGDFTDLAALLHVAKAYGAAGIGLNPLHALDSERPNQRSPYSPGSRAFLNPLYIDVEQAPGFHPSLPGRDDAAAISRCRDAELVDYVTIAELKLRILRDCHARLRQAAPQAQVEPFAAFKAERGEALLNYARFEVYRRLSRSVWWDWPADYGTPQSRGFMQLDSACADDIDFEMYLQWVADRQLGACRDLARELSLEIGLYLDLAVGVDAGGADNFMERDAMLTGLSVGAPPDAYNPAGQNWGLTTYSPHGLIAHDFAPLRRMLASAMRHAGAIRLDHVLGLMRLYVIPQGDHARDGVYIRFPFSEMLRVVAEESLKHDCIVIGEDLGTVPENFRGQASAAGLWSYLVMLFEREWDGAFRPPEHYPERALATFDTHDMATFTGWIEQHDLAVKREIGVDPGETPEDRARSVERLADLMRQRGEEPGRFAGAAAFLASTPSRLVSVSIEDALDLREQVNIPGTIDEHPNWARRLPISLEELADHPNLRRLGDIFRNAGRC